MKIIAIETATSVCGIAYVKNGISESIIEADIPREHAEKLPLFYEELIEKNKIRLSDLDAISVSIGPGSFTGLRIGLSYAKGLAYSNNLPIIPVSTLFTMVYGSSILNEKVMCLVHSHGKKYFSQQIEINEIGKINKKLSQIKVLEIENIATIDEEIFSTKIVHFGCNHLFNKFHSNKLIEVSPSAKWIGELGSLNFRKWVKQKPFKLVPEYVSPFKIGQ